MTIIGGSAPAMINDALAGRLSGVIAEQDLIPNDISWQWLSAGTNITDATHALYYAKGDDHNQYLQTQEDARWVRKHRAVIRSTLGTNKYKH